MVLLSAVVTRSGWKFIDSKEEDAWAAEQKFEVTKIAKAQSITAIIFISPWTMEQNQYIASLISKIQA